MFRLVSPDAGFSFSIEPGFEYLNQIEEFQAIMWVYYKLHSYPKDVEASD